MTEQQRLIKNKNIKLSMQATHAKRQNQTCKVISVKIDESRLNVAQKLWVSNIFLEAKWFYNYCVSREDLLTLDTKLTNVKVLNKDRKEEWRKLEFLSSQMKQELHARILDSISGLSSLKKKGYRVGKIRFSKNVNSIPLKQFKKTWLIQSIWLVQIR